MRTKKYLIGMLAALAFTGCSSDESVTSSSGDNGKTNEPRYLSVNIVSAPSTRADDNYKDGETTENTVNNIAFFFFKQDGTAFPVNTNQDCNYTIIDNIADSNDKYSPNVEKILSPIVVINAHTGELPASVIAVANAPTSLTTGTSTFSVSELKAKIGDYSTTEGFVMSNSVYMNNRGEVVTEVPLEAKNLTTSEELAKQNPVNIYIERVLAKVQVSTNKDEAFDTESTFDGETVYAKVEGWYIANIAEKSYLLKNISTDWTEEELGFAWNNAAYFRSYWAATPTNVNILNNKTYEDNAINAGGCTYCQENRNTDKPTTVIVKASLVNEENNAVEIAEWFGHKYTVDGLKNAIATSLRAQLYYKKTEGDNETTYESILPEHNDFAAKNNDEAKNYEVLATLATGENVPEKWYDANGNELDETAINKIFADVKSAMIWKDGSTYYTLKIEHLGKEKGKRNYAVIRNHFYDITITGIKGLGTPVYDPTQVIIPTEPDTEKSYVAAKINILSWRIVKNDVTLGQ